MAFDQHLASRVRAALGGRGDASEKEMFGGVAFLVAGKMACGIIGRDLMVRVGPPAWQSALAEPHSRPMDFTGKPMNGYVYVAPAGVTTDARLRWWVQRGIAFVETLDVDPPRRANAVAPASEAKASKKTRAKKQASSRKKTPAKKTPAKKAPSKKTPSKKAPSKKTPSKKASRKSSPRARR